MRRLLIVDDHMVIRQGLKELVESTSDNLVTVEMCSGKESIKLVQKETYDVVLINATLSTIDSIELLKQIRDDKPKLPVLILSGVDEEQYFNRLIRAGVTGILTKESASTELLDALEKVSNGRRYISPSLVEVMTGLPSDVDMPLPEILSDREYEVLVSMASGKKNKQIADEMSLSVKTISTYHSRILQKLKLENDAQLIRYAIEQGIIRDSFVAREKLLVSEFNIKTAPVIRAIKEIWNQRKLVIITIAIVAILAYIVFTYLVKFISFIF